MAKDEIIIKPSGHTAYLRMSFHCNKTAANEEALKALGIIPKYL